jgi:hypothetical protein
VSKPATRAPRGNPAAAKVLEAIRWEIDADADAVRTGAFVDEAEHSAMPDGGMRVSDAERDAALEKLGEHASVGRLTLDELEDRAGRMLAAKTRAEVQELTSDLPSEPAVPARRRRPARWLVAVLGGSQRRGRFRAAGTVNMIALMGGDHVDFRDAEIDGGEVTVNAVSIMGGGNFYVPDTIEVEVEGFSILGGNSERGGPPRLRPGAPLVRIRAYNLMGGSTIWRLPPEARGKSLKDARKLARAAERGKLPGLA